MTKPAIKLLQKPTVLLKLIKSFQLFTKKIIGRRQIRPKKKSSHVSRWKAGILTNFSSTVISCVSCSAFSASLDADVLVDLKNQWMDITLNSPLQSRKLHKQVAFCSHRQSWRMGWGESTVKRKRLGRNPPRHLLVLSGESLAEPRSHPNDGTCLLLAAGWLSGGDWGALCESAAVSWH